MTHPKVGPRQLLRVKNRDLWSCLRTKLVEGNLDCGFVGCRLCKESVRQILFTLFSSDETSEGQLLLDVDDFIEGGNDLRSAGQEGTRFAGRRVEQHPDFRITVSMDEYVKSKLRPIEVPKGYLSNTKEISVGMLRNVKGVNGGLGWLASTGRPDMAAPHSNIPSGYDRRSPQSVKHAELRWTTFTDSGFDTGERQRHQQGWLVCATNKYFNQERSAPVSVLHWRSRKLTRKARSPQLVETYAGKFSSCGDDLDQSIVGIDDLERF